MKLSPRTIRPAATTVPSEVVDALMAAQDDLIRQVKEAAAVADAKQLQIDALNYTIQRLERDIKVLVGQLSANHAELDGLRRRNAAFEAAALPFVERMNQLPTGEGESVQLTHPASDYHNLIKVVES